MPRLILRWQRWLSPAVVLLFLGVWECAYRLHWVSPVLLSAPTKIITQGYILLQNPAFHHDIAFTLSVYLLSLVLATLIGTSLGFLIGYSPVVYHILNPFIVVINSLPKIVLMPLIVLWVGIGMSANTLLGTLMASFPILTATYTGIRQIERDFLLLARAFGAKPGFIIRHILLPGVMPFTLAGLRVGINYAMVGVLIAEFFASSQGIGYRMVLLMANFQVDAFFVCLVLIASVTLTGTTFVHWLEQSLQKWQPNPFQII